MLQRFGTALIDPPWITERGGGKSKRGADRHFPLMRTRDIAALPVRPVMAQDAFVWMWATAAALKLALDVFDAWGVRYVTNRVWTKPGAPGLGQYVRMKHEHLLLGVYGKPGRPPPALRFPSALDVPRGAHSAKPPIFRTQCLLASPGPHLELFARGPCAPPWRALGNEVDGRDMNDALRALAGELGACTSPPSSRVLVGV